MRYVYAVAGWSPESTNDVVFPGTLAITVQLVWQVPFPMQRSMTKFSWVAAPVASPGRHDRPICLFEIGLAKSATGVAGGTGAAGSQTMLPAAACACGTGAVDGDPVAGVRADAGLVDADRPASLTAYMRYV